MAGDNKGVAASHLVNFYATIDAFMHARGIYRIRMANLQASKGNPTTELSAAILDAKNNLLYYCSRILPYYFSFAARGIIKKDTRYDGVAEKLCAMNPDGEELYSHAELLGEILYIALSEDIIADLLDSAQEYMSQVYAKPAVAAVPAHGIPEQASSK